MEIYCIHEISYLSLCCTGNIIFFVMFTHSIHKFLHLSLIPPHKNHPARRSVRSTPGYSPHSERRGARHDETFVHSLQNLHVSEGPAPAAGPSKLKPKIHHFSSLNFNTLLPNLPTWVPKGSLLGSPNLLTCAANTIQTAAPKHLQKNC